MGVLLLEFINSDMFPGQLNCLYPFIQGHLVQQGVACRWLRFGLTTDHFYIHGRDEVTLTGDEMGAVLAAAREIGARIITRSHPIRPDQEEEIRGLLGGAVEFVVGDAPYPGREEWSSKLSGFGLVTPADLQNSRPEYQWFPGNERAADPASRMVYIRSGMGSCGYWTSVQANPLYADLQLPEGTRRYGCAFCGRQFPKQDQRGLDRFHVVRAQLQGILRSVPVTGMPRALVFEDLEESRLLPAILEEMERLGMSDVHVLFGARADQFVRLRGALEEYFTKNGDSVPSVHLFVMGLENWSDSELLRLNKGFDGLTVLQAVNGIRELETRFPGRFVASGYMLYSVILFSPWTRLEDVHLNLRCIQHLAVDGEIGSLFLSRLRLHDNLAITHLARRDGLLVEDTDDVSRMNRRKLFGHEEPWRFQDLRLEPVDRLAARLQDDGRLEGEPLYDHVAGQLASHQIRGRRTRLDLFRSIVEVALDSPGILQEEQLLDAAMRHHKGRREGSLAGGATGVLVGQTAHGLGEGLSLLGRLLQADGKRVVTIEGVPSSDVEALDHAAFKTHGWVLQDHESLFQRGRSLRTVVLAVDAASMKEYRELKHRIDSRTHGWRQAVADLGLLLGIPSCCASAWASKPWAGGEYVGWALMDQLEGSALEGFPSLWAVPDIVFVPCQAACTRASGVLETWHARLEMDDAGEGTVWLAGLDEPVGRSVVCCSAAFDSGGVLKYAVQSVAGNSRMLIEALARGDGLRVGAGQVAVQERGRTRCVFSAEVGVFGTDVPDTSRLYWEQLCLAARYRHVPELRLSVVEADKVSRALSLDPKATFGKPDDRFSPEGKAVSDFIPFWPDGPSGIGDGRSTGPGCGCGNGGGESQDEGPTVLGIDIAFQAADGVRAPLFHVSPADPGRRYFVVEGQLALTHPPGDEALRDFAALGRICRQAMVDIQSLPEAGDEQRWTEAIRNQLSRSPLAGRINVECSVCPVRT
jgi:hypothetical protein